jgi:hypothetical protein
MTDDPCLTCPLADCNERDPRCGWRKTDEYLRQRASDLRWNQRRRELKAARKAKAESRYARLLREGLDTYAIAQRLNVPEDRVYNEVFRGDA